MKPTLISGPMIEPVSLAEMKAWLREDGNDEDQLIQALIVAARMTLEAYTRRFFVTQGWRITLDAWPFGTSTLSIPFAPFQTIFAIRIFNTDDIARTLAPISYRAPPASEGGRVIFAAPPPAPERSIDGIEIDFSVGYGASASQTPEPLRRAIMMLGAYWREKRGDDGDDALPKSVAMLAAPFRRARLS